MAATNISVWAYNIGGASEPFRVKGLVQAGSTQAIKKGELCTWNETSGYWQPISAAADIYYLLAFADEEISSITAPAARYSTFIVPRPDDVFSIELAAAASIALQANYEPTGTNSQTATLDADGDPVFCSVGDANYPTTAAYAGTSIASASHGLFTMNPQYSYYKALVRDGTTHKKVISVTADVTLLAEWSGAVVHSVSATAAYVVSLPTSPPLGTHFYIVCGSANALSVNPGTGSVLIAGDTCGASQNFSFTDEADFASLVAVGANQWIAFASISGTNSEITIAT